MDQKKRGGEGGCSIDNGFFLSSGRLPRTSTARLSKYSWNVFRRSEMRQMSWCCEIQRRNSAGYVVDETPGGSSEMVGRLICASTKRNQMVTVRAIIEHGRIV